MKFNSQICTTKQQSERLLALGLKKETADMSIHTGLEYPITTPYKEVDKFYHKVVIPAWSLHRLIEMLGVWYLELWFNTDAYDQVITLIAERIEDGLFNKKYLEE